MSMNYKGVSPTLVKSGKGAGQKPATNEIGYGQLVVNYEAGGEQIYTKNSQGNIVNLLGGGSGGGLIKFQRYDGSDSAFVFEDINDFYNSARDYISEGRQLYEPEDGKICVAELEDGTYIPIISPEPSFDSIVDPNKKRTHYEITHHSHRPYNNSKIVVRKQLPIQPVENLPYYFQDGIITVRIMKEFLRRGKSIAFYVHNEWFEEPKIVENGYGSDAVDGITFIDHGNGLWELKNGGSRDQWCPLVIQIPTVPEWGSHRPKNVIEITNSERFKHVETDFENTTSYNFGPDSVKLGKIGSDEYYNRETLSPYLKFVRTEGSGIKLINIKPSFWKGIADHDGEVIYENSIRYDMLMGLILDKAPNTFVKSKTRDYVYRYHKRLADHKVDAGYKKNGVRAYIENGFLYVVFYGIPSDINDYDFSIYFTSKVGHYQKSVDLAYADIENLAIETYNHATSGKVFKVLFDGDDFYELGDSFYGWDVDGVHATYNGNGTMTLLGDRDKKTLNKQNKRLTPFGWFKGGYGRVGRAGRNTYRKINNNKGRYKHSYAIKLYKIHRGIPSSCPTTVIVRKTRKR